MPGGKSLISRVEVGEWRDLRAADRWSAPFENATAWLTLPLSSDDHEHPRRKERESDYVKR